MGGGGGTKRLRQDGNSRGRLALLIALTGTWPKATRLASTPVSSKLIVYELIGNKYAPEAQTNKQTWAQQNLTVIV